MKSKKDLISIRGHSGITPTGWNLLVASEEQWIVAGEVLVEIDQARQWWLGDWWNACKWGDGKVACEMIGVNYENATMCGKVSREFEIGRRRPILTFSHHKEVAFIDDKAIQDELLDWAEQRKATVRALREKVKEHMVTDIIEVIEEKEPLIKETDPEVKEVLKKAIEIIEEKAEEIWQDDLTDLVNTVADNVEGHKAASVLGHASRTYHKIGPLSNRKPKIPREKSDVEIMVNVFHGFLRRLEKVQYAGHKNMSERDREMMTDEFRLMVPKALRLFDWMGIDLEILVTNYVNRYKEVQHAQPNAQRLVGD